MEYYGHRIDQISKQLNIWPNKLVFYHIINKKLNNNKHLMKLFKKYLILQSILKKQQSLIKINTTQTSKKLYNYKHYNNLLQEILTS